MSGGTLPRHTHSHHVTVAVCDPHPSAGPRYAVVNPVTVTGQPVVAVACLRCIAVAVPPRPLCTSTLRSYVPQPTLTHHLSRHNVSYYYNFKSGSSQLQNRCRDSSVTIVIKLLVGQPMNRGPILLGQNIFSPQLPDRFSGPSTLLYNRYRHHFSGE
jgi:hypothetical protein